MHKLYLALAIVLELLATSALKSSESFTKPLPSLFVLVGYSSAFYLLSLCLEKISVGAAYAVWSGMGIVLIALVGAFYYKQALDLAALVGMALILSGVLVMNLFSKSVAH